MEDYVLKGVINHIHDLSGFNSCRLTELAPGHAVVETVTHDGLSNCYHKVHGGSLMTLVDMVASAAGYAYGKHVVTLQSSTNFIRGVKIDGRKIFITADVIHNGSTTLVVETVITDEDGKECVRNLSTMFVPKNVEESDPIPDPPGAYDCDSIVDRSAL